MRLCQGPDTVPPKTLGPINKQCVIHIPNHSIMDHHSTITATEIYICYLLVLGNPGPRATQLIRVAPRRCFVIYEARDFACSLDLDLEGRFLHYCAWLPTNLGYSFPLRYRQKVSLGSRPPDDHTRAYQTKEVERERGLFP